MSGNELFVWLGFLTLFASMVLLWYIKKKRDGYFSDLSQRELGAMEQYSTIIYILFLIFISGILLIEMILVSDTKESISGLYRFNGATKGWAPNNVSGLIWPYIGLCFTVMCFALFASSNEISLSKRMSDARRKLLLGELPEENEFSDTVVTPTSSPMPPSSGVESNEPATFAAVLQAMDLQLKQAEQAAEDLKSELDETKEKVVTLEIEVQERDSEIKQIKESKSHFDKMIQESLQSKDEEIGKSLSLTDSVMVGDFVMEGVKIDKQINNDPEAIARAVIDAYRMGQNDK
ncbi:hypothetical protein [Candidatus Poseidonia alphae]|uniref:hypothetical protein n=1 Tax=Candidatus Poseidonia alphae TaxID=1915863 RepID=UPI0030C6EF8B